MGRSRRARRSRRSAAWTGPWSAAGWTGWSRLSSRWRPGCRERASGPACAGGGFRGAGRRGATAVGREYFPRRAEPRCLPPCAGGARRCARGAAGLRGGDRGQAPAMDEGRATCGGHGFRGKAGPAHCAAHGPVQPVGDGRASLSPCRCSVAGHSWAAGGGATTARHWRCSVPSMRFRPRRSGMGRPAPSNGSR